MKLNIHSTMKTLPYRRQSGFTLVELLVVITIIAVLAGAGFAAGHAAIQKAKRTTALATLTGIESAVNNFYTEYGAMPSEKKEVNTTSDTSLVKTLIGEDATTNTRNVKFLSVKEVKKGSKKDGLDYTDFKLYDPWGNALTIYLDSEYTEKLTVSFGGKDVELNGRRVAVSSVGADKKAGTNDDVKTW